MAAKSIISYFLLPPRPPPELEPREPKIRVQDHDDDPEHPNSPEHPEHPNSPEHPEHPNSPEHRADPDVENGGLDEEMDEVLYVPGRKRPIAPEFGIDPIQIRKERRVGNIVLTSVESTETPVLSVRARSRASKTLHTRGKEVVAETDSRLEISLRVRSDNKDKSLETREIDGVLRLYCKVCMKAINANKTHTRNHLMSAKHTRKLNKVSKTLDEVTSMVVALSQWRRRYPDREGRTLDERTNSG